MSSRHIVAGFVLMILPGLGPGIAFADGTSSTALSPWGQDLQEGGGNRYSLTLTSMSGRWGILPSAPWSQEDADRSRRSSAQGYSDESGIRPLHGESSAPTDRGISSDLSAGWFVSGIEGNAVDVGIEGVKYQDLFRTGSGFNLQYRLHFPVGRNPSTDASLGPCFLLDYVRFGGAREVDDLGDSLEPDEMTITRVLLGVQGCLVFGRVFYLGAQMALGVAHISGVDGTLDLSGSGLGRFDVEVYAPTWTVGFELSLRLGGQWELGEGASLGILGFAGLGVTGPPKNGDDMDMDAQDIATPFAGLGVSLGF